MNALFVSDSASQPWSMSSTFSTTLLFARAAKKAFMAHSGWYHVTLGLWPCRSDGGRFPKRNSPILRGSLHVLSWQRARPSTATSTKNLFSPTEPAHFPPRLPSWRCRAKNASGFVGSFFGRSSGSKLGFGGGGSLAGGGAAAAVDWRVSARIISSARLSAARCAARGRGLFLGVVGAAGRPSKVPGGCRRACADLRER